MPILGAHMSIAGGYWRAVESAAQAGCDCVQVFTKNNNQWRAKPMVDQDRELFQKALSDFKISHTLSHASYLINLASPKYELRQKSIDAMVVELQRAEFLGIPYVVFHPGSHTTATPEQGIGNIVQSLDEVLERTADCSAYPLLENTAGQGSNLGWDFRQLGQIIQGVRQPDRLGVCIDTCHLFAAGYSMQDVAEYNETVELMKRGFGIRRIKAFHLNDSKKPHGSRVDRHEHIGLGEMGVEPFRLLINDSRFQQIPMYLETEKGERDGRDWDVINLETLRSLVV